MLELPHHLPSRRMLEVVVVGSMAAVCASACSGSSGEGSSPVVVVLPDAGVLSDLPATSCGPGTAARVGQPGCAPIGPTSCPAGFATADSGWGCKAVQPTAPCTGNLRGRIGQTSCVPVDDCAAAFPPANADVVVSPGGSAPAVSTIAEALAMVPPGGTVAIDAGTYNESIVLTQNVNLVGRCASTVIVEASGLRGVFASGYFTASLQSLTVRGGQGGIVAAGANITASHLILLDNASGALAGYGGSVTLSSSLIDGGGQVNDPTSLDAALVVLSGSTVTADDVEVRNFSPAAVAYDASSTITLTRSLVSYLGPGSMTSLLSAWTGSSVVVQESALSTLESGVFSVGASLPGMMGAPASIAFTSSEITQTGYNRQDILMSVSSGATATLDRTSVRHQAYIGLFVGDAGSKVTVTSSVIRGEPTFDVVREALQVGLGASAELDDTAVVDPIQAGVFVGDEGSSLTLKRDLITGTTFVGPGPDSQLKGAGIALGAGSESTLFVTDTSLVKNQQFGLYVASQSVSEVSGLLVDGMLAAPSAGSGIFVEDGGELSLLSAVLRNSAESAVACVSGGAIVGTSTFVGNKVALAVDSSIVVLATDAPSGPSKNTVVLYEDAYGQNDAVRGPAPSSWPAYTPPL